MYVRGVCVCRSYSVHLGPAPGCPSGWCRCWRARAACACLRVVLVGVAAGCGLCGRELQGVRSWRPHMCSGWSVSVGGSLFCGLSARVLSVVAVGVVGVGLVLMCVWCVSCVSGCCGLVGVRSRGLVWL